MKGEDNVPNVLSIVMSDNILILVYLEFYIFSVNPTFLSTTGS